MNDSHAASNTELIAGRPNLPWLVMIAVGMALLLPHFFSSPSITHNPDGSIATIDKASWNFGWPRVYSGDEPHYLLQLNSLIEDGDLDLRNNYDLVDRGSAQAGKLSAGQKLDHHTSWYHDGKYYEHANWNVENETVEINSVGAPQAEREYSRHPPGMVWLLWPFARPFRGTDLVEPVAILTCGMAVVIAMYFFALLIAPYATERHSAAITIVLAFLATPVWHYGRTLFTEPLLLVLVVGGVALYLRKSWWLLSGLLFGIAALIKPPIGLVAVPFAVHLLLTRQVRGLFLLCTPLALAVVATLANNYAQHGSPLAVPQQLELANPAVGALGQIFSWRKGVLFFAPVVLVAACWWPRFYREHRRDAILLLSAVALYYAFLACYKHWSGGFCYGPRYLTAVLPLLLVPLATLRAGDFAGKPLRIFAVAAVSLLSILINFVGAVPFWTSWNIHPAIYLLARILQ
jgi:4-amino-4-deoxy-L-arabinose transferase-like glycosyltransferase